MIPLKMAGEWYALAVKIGVMELLTGTSGNGVSLGRTHLTRFF